MSPALCSSRWELVELRWHTTLSSTLEEPLADPLAQLSIYLEMVRKWKWRDPDSNRGHHDFQPGYPTTDSATVCRINAKKFAPFDGNVTATLFDLSYALLQPLLLFTGKRDPQNCTASTPFKPCFTLQASILPGRGHVRLGASPRR